MSDMKPKYVAVQIYNVITFEAKSQVLKKSE